MISTCELTGLRHDQFVWLALAGGTSSAWHERGVSSFVVEGLENVLKLSYECQRTIGVVPWFVSVITDDQSGAAA